MINLEEQISLFKIIGSQLKTKVECIAIGGSAMMFYGVKSTTRDVDLVFLKIEYVEAVKKILFDSGFDERKNIRGIFREDEEAGKPVMMDGTETRFDLFLNEVIGFRIHGKILERVLELHEFGNLIVKTASPEDILMMKACTERDKDRDDAAEIMRKFNINWGIVLGETSNQTKIGIAAFPILIYDFLTELKDNYKIDVPKNVIKDLLKIAEERLKELKKKDKLIRVTKFKN
ncbi:nucleotidyltransferase [Candidatus Woesearchaeota archaeon]|nr:nucleotidyltransferase [Candidatus Woesearchaeota archaeon]